MRLIDADKLLKQLEWLDIDDFILYEEVKEDIDESPTVKAIPIEWIRNYVSHWVSEIYKNFALNMIKTWEKENATEITD